MAKRKKIAPLVFLPDYLDQVKAVAMQGLSDSEMAEQFGIPKTLISKWKKFYPAFEEAIEKGRTMADVAVVQALHKKAIGFDYHKDVISQGEVFTIQHVVEPETNAIKYWLNNRQPKHWGDKQHHEVSGKAGAPPIGMKMETKIEVMNSILNLVQPKEDEPPERIAPSTSDL